MLDIRREVRNERFVPIIDPLSAGVRKLPLRGHELAPKSHIWIHETRHHVVHLGQRSCSTKRVSMSSATTRLLPPTRLHGQSAMVPPPAPTSRQCQPADTPSPSRLWIVAGSRPASTCARRSLACVQALSYT